MSEIEFHSASEFKNNESSLAPPATSSVFPGSLGGSTFSTVHELSDKEFHQRLIPVVYLIILMVIGIPGNISVIFVYFRRVKVSTHRNFLITLATIDFSACVINIPFEIAEMRFQYTFYAEGACKLFRGLSVTIAVSSIFVLVTLSVDRFRRVCKPLKHQITTRQALKISLLLISLAFLISLPNFVLSGTRHVLFQQPDNSSIIGYDCSISDAYVKTLVPTIYNGILFLIFLSSVVTLIVLYSCMGYKIRAHGRFRNRFSSKTSSTENTTSTIVIEDQCSKDKETAETPLKILHKKSSEKTSNKVPKKTDSERSAKITKIALAISVAFILSYMPHLVLSLLTAIKGGFIAKPSPLVLALFPILTRSTFINNIINPFIYAALDPKFRHGLMQTLRFIN